MWALGHVPSFVGHWRLPGSPFGLLDAARYKHVGVLTVAFRLTGTEILPLKNKNFRWHT